MHDRFIYQTNLLGMMNRASKVLKIQKVGKEMCVYAHVCVCVCVCVCV